MTCSPHTPKPVHREILDILKRRNGFTEDQAHDWFHDLSYRQRRELMIEAEQAIAERAMQQRVGIKPSRFVVV